MTKGWSAFRRFGPEHVFSLGVCDACYRGHPEACSCTWEQIVFGEDLTVGALRCEVDPQYRGVRVLRTQAGLPAPDPNPPIPVELRNRENRGVPMRLKRKPDLDLSALDEYVHVVPVTPQPILTAPPRDNARRDVAEPVLDRALDEYTEVVFCVGGRRYARRP